MPTILRVCTTAGLCAAGLLLTPGRAEACGGTFCDGAVPGPMPVDQTGENVIFVMGGDKAEVHIQISIDPNTNAQKFAWMIPLASVPDFAVGSQPFFDQVLAGTVPTYDIVNTFEPCNLDGAGSSPTEGGAATTSGGGDEFGGLDVIVPDNLCLVEHPSALVASLLHHLAWRVFDGDVSRDVARGGHLPPRCARAMRSTTWASSSTA